MSYFKFPSRVFWFILEGKFEHCFHPNPRDNVRDSGLISDVFKNALPGNKRGILGVAYMT